MRTFTVAVIEAAGNPAAAGLRADPFAADFRRDDLHRWIEAWLALGEKLVGRAAAAGADLAVLGEDFTRAGIASTFLDDPSVFRGAAEQQAEVVPRRLGALAARHRCHLAACYYAAEGTLVHNVADLFGPDGRQIGRYRKVHLPPYERWLVAAGSAYPVFASDLGKVGMLICYDQLRPEAFAALALGGAEIVLHPSAETVPEYRMRCRAADHHLFYASACPRGSAVVSPAAAVLARSAGSDPGIVSARLEGRLLSFGDPAYWDAVYSGIVEHRWRELRCRRPETYGLLVDPAPPVLADAPCLAASPEDTAKIYERHREARRAAARGAAEPYHWDYGRGETLA